jgi:hypothetical protein
MLTCRSRQSRLELQLVAGLHHLQAALCVSGIGVACGEDDMRAQRTSMMHDVPRDFLHQILECDFGELGRKDILNQVRIAFSDFVTDTQY